MPGHPEPQNVELLISRRCRHVGGMCGSYGLGHLLRFNVLDKNQLNQTEEFIQCLSACCPSLGLLLDPQSPSRNPSMAVVTCYANAVMLEDQGRQKRVRVLSGNHASRPTRSRVDE